MDERARIDPREAVGGLWSELGEFQLRLLQSHGLEPQHTLLDVGAGSLRGGVHLVRYLAEGNYWGTDLSSLLLESGRKHLTDVGLLDKRPNLLQVQDFSFDVLAGRQFDYVLAFGVFTDIPEHLVEDCFRNLGRIMAPGGQFLATFALGSRYEPDSVRMRFRYPWSTFERLAARARLTIELTRDIGHPKGHSLLLARRAP